MIRGEIIAHGPQAHNLYEALEPDNVGFVQANVEDDCLIARFKAERFGTIIATVNDYLVNLRIAEQLLEDSS